MTDIYFNWFVNHLKLFFFFIHKPEVNHAISTCVLGNWLVIVPFNSLSHTGLWSGPHHLHNLFFHAIISSRNRMQCTKNQIPLKLLLWQRMNPFVPIQMEHQSFVFLEMISAKLYKNKNWTRSISSHSSPSFPWCMFVSETPPTRSKSTPNS